MSSDNYSSRRVRALGAFSLLGALVLLYPNVSHHLYHISGDLGMYTSSNSTREIPLDESASFTKRKKGEKKKKLKTKIKEDKPTSIKSTTQGDKTPSEALNKKRDEKLDNSESICKVQSQVDSSCGSYIGKRLTGGREKLVKGIPANPRAHLFAMPAKVRDNTGQHPMLCVPQKNGNKQFGGLAYVARNKKPPKTGYEVDRDMKHWEHHSITSRTSNSHIYFVARNPYSRILSLYLQKAVGACITDSQKGCNRRGWKGMNEKKTTFPEFVKHVALKAKQKGSLCAYNVHLCLQVSTCLAATLKAKEVTIIRVEEQSCWFPCLVKQFGIKSSLLTSGWDEFSGHSCYYTSTGQCKDMLKTIDPSKVGVATGNVHATGASNRLAEYYDEETAAIVSRIYADDFAILEYPLWDGKATNHSSLLL